jgi:septum formation protein
MRGHALLFHTAVSLAVGDRVETEVTQTRLVMRNISDAAIRAYVARDKPFDCAGGFKAEALGIALFESIESNDPSALIGLPLIALNTLLLRFGFALLGEAR